MAEHPQMKKWKEQAVAAFKTGPDANIEWLHNQIPDVWRPMPNPYPADAASLSRGKRVFQDFCINCHGTMATVAQNPSPWLNEPRCDNAACHGSAFAQDQPLYRESKGHGAVFCEGCHDSTHAIAPSRESNDKIKFVALQGYPNALGKCTVCHRTWPTTPGPHGILHPKRPLPDGVMSLLLGD